MPRMPLATKPKRQRKDVVDQRKNLELLRTIFQTMKREVRRLTKDEVGLKRQKL